uniref:Olfactory receptor family 3 subfamily A member 10 n=1 Tax=Jaculus jaculus TaxID=51337 RepID=A0A8C5L8Y4_JACJA
GNRTTVTEFISQGLTEHVGLQYILFVAIFVEPKLHTLMYYFLGNLSLLDIGCIPVTVPQMLVCLLSHQCIIPFAACFSQLFFIHLLAGVDCHLLTAMPLTCSTCMSLKVQGTTLSICFTISFINALTHTVAVSMLDFCGPTVVNHFYCDFPPLVHLNGQLLFAGATFMGVIPMILISVSYAYVAAAVLWLCSAEGRKKAFSICGSRLTVVCLFYGTGFFSYMHLGSVSASDKDKDIGIFNTILSPVLNPVIYSLHNPDVQGALKRILTGRKPPV